jgi:hypothetical protein
LLISDPAGIGSDFDCAPVIGERKYQAITDSGIMNGLLMVVELSVSHPPLVLHREIFDRVYPADPLGDAAKPRGSRQVKFVGCVCIRGIQIRGVQQIKRV